jgi:hypothetical protein
MTAARWMMPSRASTRGSQLRSGDREHRQWALSRAYALILNECAPTDPIHHLVGGTGFPG